MKATLARLAKPAFRRQSPLELRTATGLAATYAVLGVVLVVGYRAIGHLAPAGWDGILATMLVLLAFVPVRHAVEALVDRLFFRAGYDFREVVARLTATGRTTLDVDETKLQFMIAIDGALHPRFIYILTRLAGADVLATVGLQATWGDTPSPELHVLADDPLLVRFDWDLEVDYLPSSGVTGQLSPMAALGAHYRIPLAVGDEVVGLVILGPKASGEPYSTEDRELLAATRLPLATALKTAAMLDDRLFKDRMDQELRRAREVQEAMLPEGLPEVRGYGFAASSIPCLEASGDYYDFVELPDGRLGVAVADVAGKGIAAALATAVVKSGLYTQTQVEAEPVAVLTALNRLIFGVSRRGSAKSFTTCLYAVLDPRAGLLAFACAGHPPPHHYVAKADRFAPFPLMGGFPLGVRPTTLYKAQETRLAPGDVLVFYTDGVTEAQAPDDLPPYGDVEPGEPFETDRLAEVIRANRSKGAAEIHDAIKQAIDVFVAGKPLADDVTLVVIKVLPPPSAAATGQLGEPT